MTERPEKTPAKFGMRDLIGQVAQDIAPEETRVLAALDDLSDDEALRRLVGNSGRDQRLGFGVGEAVMLSTAVAWIGVDQAVRRITDVTTRKALRAGRRLWPFSRQRGAEPVTEVPVLTREELNLVEECVLNAARDAKLPEERGRRIADGVIARLVTGPRTR